MKTYGRKGVILGITASLSLAIGFGACTSPGKKTGIGAGVGAGTGAAVGGVVGGWKGAAIGAGVGAIAGGAVGNYLDKQAKELAQVAETRRTEEGVLVKLKNDLLFETGRSELKPEATTQLTQLGDILVKYPSDRIQIIGFTDNTGGADYNQKLSERRADSVRGVLASRNVKNEQMIISGQGENNPVAPNSNASGRAKNRRVELRIDVPENQAGQVAQEQKQ